MAVWSSHDGEDTLFNQFAQEARAACTVAGNASLAHPMADGSGVGTSFAINSQPSTINSPWNLYFRVTMPDAIELGLLDVINRVKGTQFTSEQFLADCRTRAGSEEIFQQSYMCNPLGAATASIVDWSAIERCRYDYQFERLHLEAAQILQQFGQFNPAAEEARQRQIHAFIREKFPSLFNNLNRNPNLNLNRPSNSQLSTNPKLRL